MSGKPIVIMGVFVVDLAFRIQSLPVWGETVLGSDFRLGPGGKGSNQSVAAARLGGKVSFINKVGRDRFGGMARQTGAEAGIDTQFLFESIEQSTGAAAIIVDQASGENAVIIMPGAAATLTFEEIDRAEKQIADSAVFMTQLELPVPLVEHGLRIAHRAGVPTILNPAPACALPDSILQLCDYLTPNETEARALTGLPVDRIEEAERAADALLAQGARNIVVTLGSRGAFVKGGGLAEHVLAFQAGPVVETTGAGDAFNGGFAVGLSEGMDLVQAARFGCAAAGISVTRHGTAPSMPMRSEVDALMSRS
ncbi:MAG: ribokinase [Acidobacteriaceae bacterium]